MKVSLFFGIALLFINFLSYAQAPIHNPGIVNTPQTSGIADRVLSKTIQRDDLLALFQKWKLNKLLRMPDPGAHCLDRYRVLGTELERSGYYSEMIELRCGGNLPSGMWGGILGVNPDTGAIGGPYRNHFASVVNVQMPNGTLEKRVLDPQFFNEPMSFEDYFKAVVPLGSVENQPLGSMENPPPEESCTYTLRDRRWSYSQAAKIASERVRLHNEIELASIGKTKEELLAKLPAELAPFDERISTWQQIDLDGGISAINGWNSRFERDELHTQETKKWREQEQARGTRSKLKGYLTKWVQGELSNAQAYLDEDTSTSDRDLLEAFAGEGSTEAERLAKIRAFREPRTAERLQRVEYLSSILKRVNLLPEGP